MRLNPYLMFDGTCAEAFAFYADLLGTSVEALITYGDMPTDQACAPQMKSRIAHARLTVDGQQLMGSDCPPGAFEPQQGVSVHLGIDDIARARHVFDIFADGGAVHMPFAETFWAHGFGVVIDRFGTSWMVNCEKAPDTMGAG